MAPRILDLYCCAGGAGMGYHLAGFEVVGLDNKPQPNYPFEFHQADALTYPLDGFDAYHASPPCQRFSEATPMYARGRHPDLLAETRKRLQQTGKPYVIENVENARHHLLNPIMLCGTMFGLKLWRHRWFEIQPFYVWPPYTCNHSVRPVTINPPSNARKAQGGKRNFEAEQLAMGINWMNKKEIAEAIPPVFTEYIGRHILKHLCYNT